MIYLLSQLHAITDASNKEIPYTNLINVLLLVIAVLWLFLCLKYWIYFLPAFTW